MSIDFIVPYEISLIFLRELLSSSRSFPDSAKSRTINSQKEQARESSLLRAHFTFPVFDIPRSPTALRTPDTYATVCAFTLSSTSWSTRMQKALSIDRHPATKVPWHRFSSRLPDPRGPSPLQSNLRVRVSFNRSVLSWSISSIHRRSKEEVLFFPKFHSELAIFFIPYITMIRINLIQFHDLTWITYREQLIVVWILRCKGDQWCLSRCWIPGRGIEFNTF